MNSFIGWVGGKSRLKKYIIPLIPKDVERYIEVFGGAGWVFFAKPQFWKTMETEKSTGKMVLFYGNDL